MENYNLDVVFSDIKFDPPKHRYFIGRQELLAVTKKLNEIKPPFDREKWSNHVAERDGLSVQKVLDKWDNKSKSSLKKGTEVHKYIEDVLHNKSVENSYSIEGEVKAFWQFSINYRTFNRDGFRDGSRYTEYIVGDMELGLAGTIDWFGLLGNKWTIIDWKTGTLKTENTWENLLYPFDDLEHCNYVHYSLQLSIYKLILQRQLKFDDISLHMVNLQDNGNYLVLPAMDLSKRVEQWILT